MDDPQRSRLAFIDALRGLAFVFMLVNHTAIYFLDGSFSPQRQQIFYVTVTLAAPLFLFLVGLSMALSGSNSSGRPKSFGNYLTKGALLILTGFALTAVTAPARPVFTGGILQTIGLGMICLGPAVHFMRHRAIRYSLLGLAGTLYVAFVYAHPAAIAMLQASPVLLQLFFDGFPPWPWISLIMLGLVFGSVWVMEADRRANIIGTMAGAAAVCLISYLAIGQLTGTLTSLDFARDFIINGHWLPRPVTVFWILGALFVNFLAVHYLAQTMARRMTWLCTLGRSALLLYVVHLLLIRIVGKRLLDIKMESWWHYAAANVAFVAGLLLLLRLIAWFRELNEGGSIGRPVWLPTSKRLGL